MPKKKDAAIIGVVLLLAVALFAVSKMMPKTDLSTKTADVTLAPDAVEYLDETPAPEATEATAPPDQNRGSGPSQEDQVQRNMHRRRAPPPPRQPGSEHASSGNSAGIRVMPPGIAGYPGQSDHQVCAQSRMPPAVRDVSRVV